jgi:hypothetical protein
MSRRSGEPRGAWPPIPRDRLSGVCSRWVARLPGWSIVIAVVAIVAAWNVVIFWSFRGTSDRGFVNTRYNDALVDGDLAGAWALGCADDRSRVSLEEFATLVADAVEPLGGLTGWSRLRGGPEWHGRDGDVQRSPSIRSDDGHSCVGLGGDPLGEPF